MRLSTYRWLAPVPACVALQTSFGSFYATGVFTSRLHAPLLTYALGYSAAFLSASLTAAGIFLHRRPPPNSPARSLALLSAALLAVAAFLPTFSSPTSPTILLFAASAALGAGYGVIYVVSISVLQAWVPEHPGTATGAVVASGGVGTLLYVAINTALCNKYPNDIPRAMRISAAIQTCVALVSAAGVSMPPSPSWSPALEESQSDIEQQCDETSPLLDRSGDYSSCGVNIEDASEPPTKKQIGGRLLLKGKENQAPSQSLAVMTTGEMLSEPAFYILLATVTSSVGPGFGIVLHGSRMQTVLFGLTPSEADARFFYVTLVGVVGRLIVGMAVDAYAASKAMSMRRPSLRSTNPPANGVPQKSEAVVETAPAFAGAKFINAALLAAQTAALVMIFVFIRGGHALLFAIAISLVYLTFSGAAVLMACLCRATFTPINSTLAFSLIGLAIGAGDVVFSSLVASCAARHPLLSETSLQTTSMTPSTISSHAGDYNSYLVTSLLFSVIGLGSVLVLKPANGSWRKGLDTDRNSSNPFRFSFRRRASCSSVSSDSSDRIDIDNVQSHQKDRLMPTDEVSPVGL